jgi:hypothetical protein
MIVSEKGKGKGRARAKKPIVEVGHVRFNAIEQMKTPAQISAGLQERWDESRDGDARGCVIWPPLLRGWGLECIGKAQGSILYKGDRWGGSIRVSLWMYHNNVSRAWLINLVLYLLQLFEERCAEEGVVLPDPMYITIAVMQDVRPWWYAKRFILLLTFFLHYNFFFYFSDGDCHQADGQKVLQHVEDR